MVGRLSDIMPRLDGVGGPRPNGNFILFLLGLDFVTVFSVVELRIRLG